MMEGAGMVPQGEPTRPKDNVNQPTPSLTIVRIKRRRDDPAEPEIILEAAGACRNKQPRYEEFLMRFQGLSVMGADTVAAAPRRRFRRLQTLDAAMLEAMSEGELMRLLSFQSETSASAAAAPVARVVSPHDRDAAGKAPEPRSTLPTSTSTEGPLQPQLLPLAAPVHHPGPGGGDHRGDGGGHPRRAIKAASGPSPESRIAALRTSHHQAATAARYKQIRRRRGAAVANGAEGSRLQMYDLERLPAEGAQAGPSAAGEPGAGGRRQDMEGSQRPLPAHAPKKEEEGRGELPPLPQPGERPHGALPMPPPPPPPPQQQQQSNRQASAAPADSVQLRRAHRTRTRAEEAAAPGPAPTSADDALLQRYAPLVDEVLRSLSDDHQRQRQQQQQPGVRSGLSQARPKRTGQAAAASSAVAASVRPAAEAAASAVDGSAAAAPPPLQQQPDASLHTTVAGQQDAGRQEGGAGEAQPDGTVPAGGAATGLPGPQGEREDSDGEHVFVYDVYIPVHVDEFGGAEGGEGEEDSWPRLDALVDPAVPVIKVADNDDELLWGDQLEVGSGPRADADADEHDSEDSNAESYYANTYPDEEDAPYDPYGNDAGSDGGGDDDEVEEAEPPDADVGGGYGWGAAKAMRRHGLFSDDDDEEGEEDEDEEIFGRRRRRPRAAKKTSSYYRTEDDDYSEHSSFLSEEEERREAEERRRRSIFMH